MRQRKGGAELRLCVDANEWAVTCDFRAVAVAGQRVDKSMRELDLLARTVGGLRP